MTYKCEECKKNFHNKESFNQHNIAKHSKTEKKEEINYKKYFLFFIISLIIILAVLSIINYSKKPGKYDNFAKCLTEKNIVVYGNDYCSYTTKQLGFFGKSKKYLNYVKCADNEALCDNKGVKTTPTWDINGESYSGVQTFEMLSSVSGCEVS